MPHYPCRFYATWFASHVRKKACAVRLTLAPKRRVMFAAVALGALFAPFSAFSQVPTPVLKKPLVYLSGGADSLGTVFSTAVADVNGDGNPDLLVPNECASQNNCAFGTIGVLLGNGDGTFQQAIAYASGGYGASSVAVADVNGDGKLDLVVANLCVSSSCNQHGVVGVLLGNGDGTFQPAVTFDSGGHSAHSLIATDMNGDRKVDIVVANESGNVGVLLGNGDGTFQAAAIYGSGGTAISVAVADINSDGKPDIIVANGGTTDTVGVLLGNGDGTFQGVVPYSSGGSNVWSVAVGDVNGDGRPDVMVNNFSSVGVLLGNGDGTLQSAVTYSSGAQYAVSVAVGDLNRDHKGDVVISNSCSIGGCSVGGILSLLLGNGNGTFLAPLLYKSGGYLANSVLVADVNNDGKPDLIVGNECISAADCSNGTVGVLIDLGLSSIIGVTSSVNPSVFDQPLTFTASVSSSAPFATQGNVMFSDGSTALGTVAIGSSGIATFTVPLLAVGTHTITASYTGDANFAPNSSSFKQTVKKAPTKTLLTSSPNPALTGQPITFTATITTNASGWTPTGTVNFIRQSVGSIGTATLSSGTATVTSSFSVAETYKIYAVYSGDADFQSSTSVSVTQKVNKFPSATVVVSNLNPSIYAQSAPTLTATVTSIYGTPTGTVAFRHGTTLLGTASLNGEIAQFTPSPYALSAGSNYINAVYQGDASFATSTSANLAQTVNKAAATMTLAFSPNPSIPGLPITLTAMVFFAYQSVPGPIPGTVTFKKGTTLLGTASATNGVASLNVPSLPNGANLITVSYKGLNYFIPSQPQWEMIGPIAADFVGTVPFTANDSADFSTFTFVNAYTATGTSGLGVPISVQTSSDYPQQFLQGSDNHGVATLTFGKPVKGLSLALAAGPAYNDGLPFVNVSVGLADGTTIAVPPYYYGPFLSSNIPLTIVSQGSGIVSVYMSAQAIDEVEYLFGIGPGLALSD